MGLWDSLKRMMAGPGGGTGGGAAAASSVQAPSSRPGKLPSPDQGRGMEELARRLGLPVDQLQSFHPNYRQFTIPKRTGGTRTITAPDPPTKALQRKLLRRVLARLPVHPAARGFEKGQSIATHALNHAARAVVVRMDIRDFFPSTSVERVLAYFRRLGWNQQAAQCLVHLTTYQGGLPQGAPTSPRLSNLVNYRLDARLAALAAKLKPRLVNPKAPRDTGRAGAGIPGASPEVTYSRYADDLTFSFDADDHQTVEAAIWLTQKIVEDEGYRLHTKKKLRIMRRHDRQVVTGLVVNQRVQLPRARRRWLRSVAHHQATGKPATLNEAQLHGWRMLEQMIQTQTGWAAKPGGS
jgi:RNA-directed DNA polymerase